MQWLGQNGIWSKFVFNTTCIAHQVSVACYFNNIYDIILVMKIPPVCCMDFDNSALFGKKYKGAKDSTD